jgi:chemotaxis protein MotB
MKNAPMIRSFSLVASAALLLGSGCSPTQAQLDAEVAKVNELATKNQACQDELDAAKSKSAELEAQLQQLGFQLSSEGQERQKLLDALEEYKQRAAALERIKERFEKLRQKLNALTELGLTISIRNNRMVISLPGDVLFASGKDSLEKKGRDILSQVAAVIREDAELSQRTYQVAGHTDNQKLTSAPVIKEFKDNWGLSLMRARSVLLFLIAPQADEKEPGGGLNRNLWSASGYGETDPISSNAGKYGRQKNRRVELIMMPNVEEMLDLKSLAGELPPAQEDDAEESTNPPGTR